MTTATHVGMVLFILAKLTVIYAESTTQLISINVGVAVKDGTVKKSGVKRTESVKSAVVMMLASFA